MLLVKIITLAFEPIKGRFDDVLLQEFLKNHLIISIKDHFFAKNEQQYLALVITYNPAETSELIKQPSKEKVADESWRELLTEADMGIFAILKEWRCKRSKKEGLPPYILFTNRQLAEIVKAKPQTLADLQRIDGVGEGKVKKYGQDVLSITKVVGLATPPPLFPEQKKMEQATTPDCKSDGDDLPIFIKWMDFMKWLLGATEKFPKSVSFTFVDRINNLALSAVEELVEARYSKDKKVVLMRLNLKIEKLRILLRICY